MPEYLAPGVFVEEVSFRAKSVEGVPTSTTGFAGMTAYGPVRYPNGPLASEPRLVTSFVEFERLYGKLDRLGVDRLPYLAHAARAFFLNGGQRLYVSRVFRPLAVNDPGIAHLDFAVPTQTATTATWRARWPGKMGNVRVKCRVVRSRNVAVPAPDGDPAAVRANRARDGALVEVVTTAELPALTDPLVADNLRLVRVDALGRQTFHRASGDADPLATDTRLVLIEFEVDVQVDPERVDRYAGLGVDPNHRRSIGRVLARDDPEDDGAVVWLDYDFATVPGANSFALAVALAGAGVFQLANGNDGVAVNAEALRGKESDLDRVELKASGLAALGEVDDIAIVALPDAGTLENEDERVVATRALIEHAEQSRYRIAIVDGPANSSLNEIRAFRGQFDSKYAALYYPWIEVLDPNEPPEQGGTPAKLLLPPSGFVAGIYARSDIERGVHKAPANEIVRGLTRFEANINTGRQQVLNPEGINALRFFPGRGNRVWGARTLSSDPEWKYVNVRRFFIFLEHSIDKATQWAVFEPNGDDLWAKVRRSVEDFLDVQWRTGALLGATRQQAYFVRCDRTTMTQNDFDNGRMICLIGVAPVRPAEFVIFRIGQWTADARS